MRVRKDPDAVLDYGFDWSAWLRQNNGSVDSITDSSWTVDGPDSDLTAGSDWYDTDVTGVWVSGGTVGATYTLTNHITTAAGREDDRSIVMKIEQR